MHRRIVDPIKVFKNSGNIVAVFTVSYYSIEDEDGKYTKIESGCGEQQNTFGRITVYNNKKDTQSGAFSARYSISSELAMSLIRLSPYEIKTKTLMVYNHDGIECELNIIHHPNNQPGLIYFETPLTTNDKRYKTLMKLFC